MSTVIDTTAVKDTDKIRLRNLTKNPAVYITPATGVRREIPPLGYIEVTAGEIRECSYDSGCSNLLRNYVQVCNPALAREIGVSDETIEYNWGDKEVTEAVTTADMDVLLDALAQLLDGLEFYDKTIANYLLSKQTTIELQPITEK